MIKLLGGNAKAAEFCEVTPGAVSQWLYRGIPKAQLKFLRVARPEIFATAPSDNEAASRVADSKAIQLQ